MISLYEQLPEAGVMMRLSDFGFYLIAGQASTGPTEEDRRTARDVK